MNLNKITNVVIIPLIFICVNNSMAQQQEIPRSIIKGSGGIGADLSSLNGKGKLLLVDPKCSVIGLGDIPYMLFSTPEFNEEDLPSNIKENIYEVKKIVVQPTFLGVSKSGKFCVVPKWLINFKKTEYLRFAYVVLDDLDWIKDLPIQYLILENVKYNDSEKLIATIKQFKYLKEVSCDQSVSTDIRQAIKTSGLKLIIVTKPDQ
jgi:hypothetical protein